MDHRDPTGLKARVAKFDAENGNDAIRIGELEATLLFSNGARRDVDPCGVWIDAASDPIERTKWVVCYWMNRERLAREKFERTKNHYVSHAEFAVKQSAVPEPVEEVEVAKAKLTALRDEVVTCQGKLKEAQEQLSALKRQDPEAVARAKRFDAARNANQALLDTVKDIKI